MAFEPNQEYKAEISSYSMAEDNDGRPEIHIGISNGTSGIVYKLKFGKDDDKKKSLNFAVRFSADKKRLHVPAYLEQWGNGLIGQECYIRTKPWEMNNKTGVFVSQISPKPFPPVITAVASAFQSVSSLELEESDFPY